MNGDKYDDTREIEIEFASDNGSERGSIARSDVSVASSLYICGTGSGAAMYVG